MKVSADQTVLNQMEGKTDEAAGTAVAVRRPVAIGQITGGEEVSTRLKLPTLQIAYGVGGLSATFNQGDLVLDKEYLIAKRGDPLVVTFVSVEVSYKEYLTYEQSKALIAQGKFPKKYSTREEALAAKEIVDWPPKGSGLPLPTVRPAGKYQLLIQKPEGLQSQRFQFELGGKLWAPARMFLDKGAHKAVIGVLAYEAKWSLSARKGGMLTGQFTMTVATTPKNDGSGKVITLPSIKLTGSNSDEDAAKILAAFRAVEDVGDEDNQE